MTHYQVKSGSPDRGFVRPHIAIILVVALIALLGLPAYTTISITVDDAAYKVDRGASVEDVLGQGVSHEPAGDVVDMTGHLVVAGGGAPPTLVRNGIELAPSDRVHGGDVLVSRRGFDVVEKQIVTETPIPAPVESSGKGPIETVRSEGEDGVELQGTGAISGLVTSLAIVRQAEPRVIEHSYPAAGAKIVALTFDDGPWPGQTEKILQILGDEDIHATFFVLGSRVKAQPALAARVVAEGNEVESHGFSHRYLTTPDKALAKREIDKCKYYIVKATGIPPTWFRAPGGTLSDEARDVIEDSGLRIVRWDVDPQDWRKPPPWTLAHRTIDAVRPGSVVLLHDGGGDRTSTIKALPTIIHTLKAQGYTFVTLDEMGPPPKS